jgi:F0F1-type ATP synthase alpha subunit
VALQRGLIDRLPLELIGTFRTELPRWLDSAAQTIVNEIKRTDRLDEAQDAELMAALLALVRHVAPQARASEREAE